MKVPLGLLLGNYNIAKDKILIAPIEIKPHLKLPAGTILYKENSHEQTPIEKLKQVLDKLKERVTKTKNPKIFIDAISNIDKETVLYFNNNHDLVESNVLFVNIAFSDDLEYPDGHLFKILSTIYPDYYPYPDGKIKFSEIVKKLEHKKIQILNDISLPYKDSLIVEYKDILDKNKYILLREKLSALLKPVKRKDLFDLTSDSKELVKNNLYSYTKKFLYKKDSLVTEEVLTNPYIKEFLEGDPEIYYRFPDSRQGIYIADNNTDFLYILKGFLKTHFYKLLGETININQAKTEIQSKRPKFLFLGSLGNDKEFNMINLDYFLENNPPSEENSLNIFAVLNDKNTELENNIRSKGISFIFYKKDFIDNKEETFNRLKNTFDLFASTIL